MPPSTNTEEHSSTQPQHPQKSHSFTRLESPRSSPLSRSRASTLQNNMVAEASNLDLVASSSDEDRRLDADDIFEKDVLVSRPQATLQNANELDSPQDIPADFDELPIELISLIDRFIESLSAKVYNTPPSVDKLSELFQDFYLKAEALISTHISALSTRQSRGSSPSKPLSKSTSSARADGKRPRSYSSKDTLNSLDGGLEQQMLTPQEISDRRKARRFLERKRIALEEAVERTACERVYNRIWRHRSTLDEMRDEKLRSRTAALALVGIGLQDLGIDFDRPRPIAEMSEVEGWISKAREYLVHMNDVRSPSAKLQRLAAAHKSIVDLLTELHQSSSSADEILPTLIYTLITTPSEKVNPISNLHFVQRFRASSRVDGEAAYCLVNLEAAIAFLETVDLASLRSDEPLEGPPKSASRSATPYDETGSGIPSSSPPTFIPSPQPIINDPLQSEDLPTPSGPTSPIHQRKLSNLFQPPTTALGAAGDAVRTTADTIGNSLDNSLKFLFGRLKEQKVAGDGADTDGTMNVPKTLEDARKLVDPKAEDDIETSTSTILITSRSDEKIATPTKTDDSLLSAIAGRKPSRDRSVDSAQSSGSAGRRVAFAAPAEKASPSAAPPTQTANPGNAAVESMLNFGNSLNPLKGFSGFGVRGFGRTSSGGATPTATSTPTLASTLTTAAADGNRTGMDGVQEAPAAKIKPPLERFLEVSDAEDLKIREVAELLRDYRRLAEALKDLGAL